jgi:hypothetical protein
LTDGAVDLDLEPIVVEWMQKPCKGKRHDIEDGRGSEDTDSEATHGLCPDAEKPMDWVDDNPDSKGSPGSAPTTRPTL